MCSENKKQNLVSFPVYSAWYSSCLNIHNKLHFLQEIKMLKGFPGGSAVKNLPAMQESLAQEAPLEKEMATPSCILRWEIPWTEEPGGLQSKRLQESDTTQRLTIVTKC